jgi:hypothetical protein
VTHPGARSPHQDGRAPCLEPRDAPGRVAEAHHGGTAGKPTPPGHPTDARPHPTGEAGGRRPPHREPHNRHLPSDNPSQRRSRRRAAPTRLGSLEGDPPPGLFLSGELPQAGRCLPGAVPCRRIQQTRPPSRARLVLPLLATRSSVAPHPHTPRGPWVHCLLPGTSLPTCKREPLYGRRGRARLSPVPGAASSVGAGTSRSPRVGASVTCRGKRGAQGCMSTGVNVSRVYTRRHAPPPGGAHLL